MLVKIRPSVFINTDNVVSVEFKDSTNDAREVGTLIRTARQVFPVSDDAAIYLLGQMDVAQAVMLPEEPGYVDPGAPTTQPLTSRIAVLLRDEFPQGASVDQLMDTLHLDYYLTVDALMSLCAERVAQFHGTENRYYHASHYPKIYAPEREVDLLDITPFQSALRDGKLQCVECKHQSCATCVTAGTCCECDCPSFTLRVPAENCAAPNPIEESRKELLAFLEVKFPGATDNVLLALDKSAKALEQTITFLRDYKVDYSYVYDCKHLEQLEKLLQAIKLIMPNPDPSAASAAQALSPGEDTGLKEVQTNER